MSCSAGLLTSRIRELEGELVDWFTTTGTSSISRRSFDAIVTEVIGETDDSVLDEYARRIKSSRGFAWRAGRLYYEPGGHS